MSKARILIVDDEEIVRESLAGWLEQDGYVVGTAADGATALARLERERWSALLVDIKMPGMDGLEVLRRARDVSPSTTTVMMTGYGTVDTAVKAMKLGAHDYLVKPFDPEEVSVMLRDIVARDAQSGSDAPDRSFARDWRFQDLVSRNASMHAVFELTRTAARSQSTILIYGESGTGKELLARAIHAESPRRAGPFVAVSCGAITETLLESELFGHEKGAFTGAASRRRGAFETANGGTLFLDEIGDVSPKLQMDLLRALEERRFCRLGSSMPIDVDVRVIAATNRDLQQAIGDGSFRDDLFYRLNVIPITLPPLRDRREDIPLLVQHFIARMSAEMGRRIDGVSDEALAMLLEQPFRGNVRELRNIVERAMVCARGSELQPGDFGVCGPTAAAAVTRAMSLSEIEKRHITSVLEQTNGNISQSARLLEIDRATLYNKIRKYGLREPGSSAVEP